jgi:hypothetical protein
VPWPGGETASSTTRVTGVPAVAVGTPGGMVSVLLSTPEAELTATDGTR